MTDLTGRTVGAWRRSSFSNAGGNCVELAPAWRKSSHSNGGGNCVELAPAGDAMVAARDSKAPDSGMLLFPSAGMSALIERCKAGQR